MPRTRRAPHVHLAADRGVDGPPARAVGRTTQSTGCGCSHPDDRAPGGGGRRRRSTSSTACAGKNGWIRVWEREVNRDAGRAGPLGICLDITALRARRQEALDTAQRQLGAVVNVAPRDPLRHRRATASSRSRRARALEQLGRRPGQMVGTSIFEQYDGLPEIAAAARRALAGEQFDTPRRDRRDGLRHDSGAASPRAAMIGISIDVTERQRSEERLAAPRLPRRAHRARRTARTLEEQLGRDLARARRSGDAVARALPRPRPLQARQRLPRPRRRRRRCCARSRKRIAAWSAPATSSPGSAATSSCSCCPASAPTAAPARRRRPPRKVLAALDVPFTLAGARVPARRLDRHRARPGARADAASCCSSAPTSRCTRPSAPARAHGRSTSPRGDGRTATGCTLTARLRRALAEDEFEPALPAYPRPRDGPRCAASRRSCAGATP